MYDGFLGFLLKEQSQNGMLTRWMARLMQHPESKLYRFVRWVNHDGFTREEYTFETSPPCLNTWIFFRHYADIIFRNEFLAYTAMAFSLLIPPEKLTVFDVVLYIIGILSGAFSIWVKTDAFRVVKDYAWYWGDFFFMMNENLVFDRIFRIVPHPMYTLGYTFIYGAILVSRNSTVLYVGMITHICQLIFLTVVETPHMRKIYPAPESKEEQQKNKTLYDKETGYFNNDLILLKNINPTRSSDILTIIILVQFALIHIFVKMPTWAYVVEAVVDRVILDLVLGYVLKKQSISQWWYRICAKFGANKKEAFNNWKTIYNITWMVTQLSFCFCAFKVAKISGAHHYLSQVLGSAIALVGIIGAASCYDDLGDYGWFYGDFLIENVPKKLSYDGMYRFVDNPEILLNFFTFFGISLIAESWTIFFLAIFATLTRSIFVMFVERPHMKKIYNSIRSHNGIREGINDIILDITSKKTKIEKIDELLEKLHSKIEKSETEEPSDEYADKIVKWFENLLAEEEEKEDKATHQKSSKTKKD